MVMNSISALPARSVILGTQLTFNIGFYAVVPFIAMHMRDDLLMSSTMIGIVLGIRTFSQQGMFFLGGLLAQRWGYRRLMLAGCAVRVLGYLGLALAQTPLMLIASAALTGLGGAMFSPCMEALTAEIESRTQRQHPAAAGTPKPQASLFAAFAVFGELGAVAGPVLGGWLMPWGFTWLALCCAGVFALAAAVLYATVPATLQGQAAADGKPLWQMAVPILRQRDFLWFALAYSTYLFSYNQLYMAVPAEIARIGAPPMALSWLFVLASVLVIGLQFPIAALCRWMEARTVLVIGFSWMALAFAALLSSAIPGMPGDFAAFWGSAAPVTLFVVFLSLGQMFAAPVAMSLVPRFAADRGLPLYYGLLASTGGLMVLGGNVLLGLVQDALANLVTPDGVGLSWGLALLLPAASAWAMARLRLPTENTGGNG